MTAAMLQQFAMANCKNEVSLARGAGRLVSIFLPIVLAALVASGCAHTRKERARDDAARIVPVLTAALTGPAALLLTNTPGFQCQYEFSLSDEMNPAAKFTGQLFVRGSKVEFALASLHAKSDSASAYTMMWDTSTAQGFVASEGLQGYAPLGGPASFNRFQRAIEPAAAQPGQGQGVEKIMGIATGTNGENLSFELTTDAANGHLPVELHTVTGSPSFVFKFTKLQSSAPPEELFALPDGFTKYASEAALLDELADRERGLRGSPRGDDAHPDRREHGPRNQYDTGQ